VNAKAATNAEPLGAVEWDSIANGIRAADALVKAAPVEPLVFRPLTPGRYLALYAGEVEAVQYATARALEVGGESVLDHFVLPSPHRSLVPAIKGRVREQSLSAVGIIETLTVCSLIVAADAAAKTGDVRLHEIRLAMGLGGKGFVVLTGEVSDVEAAVERGSALASQRGYLLSSVVIPRPDPAALAFLAKPDTPFRDFAL
jgi:microcompartment protein CcmL/EutN